jgi:beta-N-acetylhexosaminidase
MRLLRLLLVAVLLFAAMHLKNPYTFKLQHYETPVLLGICGGMLGFSLWCWWRGQNRRVEGLFLGAFLSLFAITLIYEWRFHGRQADVLNTEPLRLRQWGQHFIIGYTNPADLIPLLERGAIGGIYLSKHNVAGKSWEAIHSEISMLQAIYQRLGLPPLQIATDQEGGLVSRLSPPLPIQPSLATLSSLAPAQQRQQAYQYGVQQGQALAALGVTWNFSPVVDLKTSDQDQFLDFHSLIHKRAIAAEAETVIRIATAYSQGLQAQGVRPTLKHFPGLGAVTADTHHVSATLALPRDQLAAQDWWAFRATLANTQAAMMLGHVVVSAVDPDYPASLSRTLVQTVIRGEWQYRGPLISDDLSMGAIYWRSGSVCQASVDALAAGVDWLLIAYDWRQYYQAMYCVLQANPA